MLLQQNHTRFKLSMYFYIMHYFFIFSASTHNLDEYINMDTEAGPGQVFNLLDFVQRFYKKEK